MEHDQFSKGDISGAQALPLFEKEGPGEIFDQSQLQ
jgi:hypothetical protein